VEAGRDELVQHGHHHRRDEAEGEDVGQAQSMERSV